MSLRSYWLLIACAAFCTALAGAWAARDLPPASPRLETGTWLPHPRTVGAFALVDQNGAAFGEAQLSGRPSLLYFGFTHSTDVCPATLAMLARVSRSNVVPRLRVIFVTLDPARDTPARLDRYVRAFDPRFIGLTGSDRQIDALAARLGIGFERIDLPGGDYTIEDAAVLYLLDAAGHLDAIFTGPFAAPGLEQDLRRTAPWLTRSRGGTHERA